MLTLFQYSLSPIPVVIGLGKLGVKTDSLSIFSYGVFHVSLLIELDTNELVWYSSD